MTPRTTAALVVVAVLAVGGGWLATSGSSAPETAAPGTLMFPGLAAKLQSAARIEVLHQAQTLGVVRRGDVWGLADRAGYPVQPEKVREVLTGLTELRQMEPRTSDPAEYLRLGVEDPAGAVATSNLLRVLGADGKPVAELIVGHRRMRTQGNLPESIYVRRPGEAQAWLVEGRMPLDADAQLWIARDIANVDHARIAAVSVTRGADHLDFTRDGDKLVLKSPADHPDLDDYKVEDIARAFETLTLTDVKPAAQEPGAEIAKSTFTTTDGVTVDVTVFKADKDIWAQFAARGEGAAKVEADALQTKLSGWAFQLGAWKEAAFAPDLTQLKAADPKPPAAAPAAPSMPNIIRPGALPVPDATKPQ